MAHPHLAVFSLIPTKKRRSVTVIETTPRCQEMHRLHTEPGDAASKRAYRQRWKVETVMPVAKPQWGEALSARTDPPSLRKLCSGGVVYYVNRIVLLGFSA